MFLQAIYGHPHLLMYVAQFLNSYILASMQLSTIALYVVCIHFFSIKPKGFPISLRNFNKSIISWYHLEKIEFINSDISFEYFISHTLKKIVNTINYIFFSKLDGSNEDFDDIFFFNLINNNSNKGIYFFILQDAFPTSICNKYTGVPVSTYIYFCGDFIVTTKCLNLLTKISLFINVYR